MEPTTKKTKKVTTPKPAKEELVEVKEEVVFPDAENLEPVIDEVIETASTEKTTEVKEEVVEPILVEAPEIKFNARVSSSKLNLRKNPKVRNDNIIAVMLFKDKLSINNSKSTPDWFYVTTEKGVEGFCMKKFVTIFK